MIYVKFFTKCLFCHAAHHTRIVLLMPNLLPPFVV